MLIDSPYETFNLVVRITQSILYGIGTIIFSILLFFFIKKHDKKNIISMLSIHLVFAMLINELFNFLEISIGENKILCSLLIVTECLSELTIVLISVCIPFFIIKILIDPSEIDKNYKKLKIITIVICWVIPCIITFALSMLEYHMTLGLDRFTCFFINQAVIYIYCSISLVIYLILFVVYWKLNKEIISFFKQQNQKISSDTITFNKFYFVVGIFIVVLIIYIFGYTHFSHLVNFWPIFSFVYYVILFFNYLAIVFIICFNTTKLIELKRFISCSKNEELEETVEINQYRNSIDINEINDE